jgi:hypothetical protein
VSPDIVCVRVVLADATNVQLVALGSLYSTLYEAAPVTAFQATLALVALAVLTVNPPGAAHAGGAEVVKLDSIDVNLLLEQIADILQLYTVEA